MNNSEAQGGDNIRRAGANEQSLQGLKSFNSLHQDYEWENGIPDVRNWPVKDARGNRIGKVDDLLVDPVQGRVRYLDVDLRDNLTAGSEDMHLLIPVGTAQIDEKEDEIRAMHLSGDQLGNYPRYNREPLTRDYEHRIRNFFGFDKNEDTGSLQTGTRSDFNEYTEGVSRTTHLMDDTTSNRDSHLDSGRIENRGNTDADQEQAGDGLSDFARRHISPPDSRENRSEPGTFTANDFYTDSHFDETRFYGHRYSGQRRGTISTFPEGEGRFTFRRRNI